MNMRAAALALLLLAAASPAPGEDLRIPRFDERGNRPIEITAEKLFADSSRNSVTFEGSVVARQDDMTLYSNKLTAEYGRGAEGVGKIVADGEVRVVQGERTARAAHAEFFNLEQRIVLTGSASVTQGGNTLSGDTVTIFLRENRSVVTGGEGGRVKAIIHPKGEAGGKGKGAP